MDVLADLAWELAYCEKAVSAGTKKKYKLKMNRLVKYRERNFPNCLNADGKLIVEQESSETIARTHRQMKWISFF